MICKKCNVDKSIDNFNKNGFKNGKQRYIHICKDCSKNIEKQEDIILKYKICTKCNVEKSVDNFNKKGFNRQGNRRYKTICKECLDKEKLIKKEEKYKNLTLITLNEKTCSCCNKTKNINEFSKQNISSLGKQQYSYICKECKRLKNKEYWIEKHKDIPKIEKIIKVKIPKIEEILIEETEKLCKTCNIIKPIVEFSKKYKTKDGIQRYQQSCKECTKIIDKKFRNTDKYKKRTLEYFKKNNKENREKILNQKKKYHLKNQKEILEKKKIYRQEHPDAGKEYFKNNPEKRLEISERYRNKYPHIVAWRQLLYRTLRYLGKEKDKHTFDILRYTAEQLKEHLENKFVEGMSWENHGEWEIDHIRPLTSFSEDTDPSIVNSLNNLQPLWKKDNITKYNHY
jgi:hypothetical protein